MDNEPHELVSGNAEHGRPDSIFNTGIIEPGKCQRVFRRLDENMTFF
jgi:hypothetical protein